jgi:hypothetical protein
MRRTPLLILSRIGRRLPLTFYAGSIVALTMFLSAAVMWWSRALGAPTWTLILLAIPLILSLSHLGVSLINWLATLLVTPRSLPRMDYSEGIPGECRTIVVVPTMLSSVQGVEDLLESLEVRFLANRDDNLFFALLTDFRDAPQEHLPEDEPLLRVAREGIEALNGKYAGDRPDVFYLFHRPRRWNESEGVWMGWERKRGKLAEFNAFLRGGPRDPFSLIVGNTRLRQSFKYVITLDTDTRLPRDAASGCL